MWEAAQAAESAAHDECLRRDELLMRLGDGVLRRVFWWRGDAYEAELEIYFERNEEDALPVQIHGCRLVRLDYAVPSARRRIEVENRFLEQLRQAGTLYDRVLSHLAN